MTSQNNQKEPLHNITFPKHIWSFRIALSYILQKVGLKTTSVHIDTSNWYNHINCLGNQHSCRNDMYRCFQAFIFLIWINWEKIRGKVDWGKKYRNRVDNIKNIFKLNRAVRNCWIWQHWITVIVIVWFVIWILKLITSYINLTNCDYNEKYSCPKQTNWN